MVEILLALLFISTLMMVTAKRVTAVIISFSHQSFILFLLTLFEAVKINSLELYIVSALILIIKAAGIPMFLRRVVRDIKVNENVGFYIPPVLSLVCVMLLSYMAYIFAGRMLHINGSTQIISFTVSLSVILAGMFMMVFRMKAITQIIGLIVIENGLFLAAVVICGGMPFFVEISIFFDLFICVIILGIFVYRINMLFTHVDVDKLTELKG
ncbi:MAG: hypothetical protein JXJ19_10335 [Elusimicrobia bacterium]|nr:hypothetical protein [Elusimicrobiota bacterium]